VKGAEALRDYLCTVHAIGSVKSVYSGPEADYCFRKYEILHKSKSFLVWLAQLVQYWRLGIFYEI